MGPDAEKALGPINRAADDTTDGVEHGTTHGCDAVYEPLDEVFASSEEVEARDLVPNVLEQRCDSVEHGWYDLWNRGDDSV